MTCIVYRCTKGCILLDMKAPTPAKAARDLQAARDRLDQAMQAAQATAVTMYDDGTPETTIAETLGVNRLTVRRWLGK
jgi:DNA invertase Pin-like site-specific DNA recombinase